MTRPAALRLLSVTVLLAIAAAAIGSARVGRADPTGGAPAAAACTPPAPGDHRITVDPARIPVLLHVPKGLGSARPPLVLVLPGAAQDARNIEGYTGYSQLADRKGFLVAYPTATGARPSWNVSGTQPGKPDDLGYLRRVILALTGRAACADPARVGVTGVSNGGGMTARLACEASDLLAAAAPVAGGYSTLPECHPDRPLPVLEIHGLKDEVVPYRGKGADHAGAVGPYIDGWRRRDGCTGKAARSAPASNVQEMRWACAGGRIVVHDRVLDAEHGWPGEDSLKPFSSTLRTWRFLTAFRLTR